VGDADGEADGEADGSGEAPGDDDAPGDAEAPGDADAPSDAEGAGLGVERTAPVPWVAPGASVGASVGAAVGEGWSGLRRRAGTFAVLAGALAFTAWAATRVVPPDPQNLRTWAPDLARAMLDSPLRWALWPGLTLAGLVLARAPAEFLSHLPGALALLGLHYLWVIRSGVAFEEAALAAAERRARAREATRRRRGGVPERRGRRQAPFRLGPSGPVELAFVWKALIATGWGRLAGRAGLLAAALVAGLVAFFSSALGQRVANASAPRRRSVTPSALAASTSRAASASNSAFSTTHPSVDGRAVPGDHGGGGGNDDRASMVVQTLGPIGVFQRLSASSSRGSHDRTGASLFCSDQECNTARMPSRGTRTDVRLSRVPPHGKE